MGLVDGRGVGGWFDNDESLCKKRSTTDTQSKNRVWMRLGVEPQWERLTYVSLLMSKCSSVNAAFYGSSKIDRLETAKEYKKFRLKFRSMESTMITVATMGLHFLFLCLSDPFVAMLRDMPRGVRKIKWEQKLRKETDRPGEDFHFLEQFRVMEIVTWRNREDQRWE